MMTWEQLLSAKRLGQEDRFIKAEAIKARSEFQRDYDRIIFSAAFRRLQDKTQVFPLPGSIFVHNRLTHSLEVASVGRSLGSMVSEKLSANSECFDQSLIYEIRSIVSAACLAHDLGNPPFGHSGETSISTYFSEGNGRELQSKMTPEEWNDFIHFDGNANAFRLLSHQFNGRREGGFALTYSTLASIVKYPFESVNVKKNKFGFFQSDKEIYVKIANELGLKQIENSPIRHFRHPLVYLVEAADDICYQIMDVEDAHKLGILKTEETCQLFRNFFDPVLDKDRHNSFDKTLKIVTDNNEQIAYLRASVIGKLINECATVFLENQDKILQGTYKSSLFKDLPTTSRKAMDKIQEISFQKIYQSRPVVEIEIAGQRIINTLLEEFIDARLSPKRSLSEKLNYLVPQQYHAPEDSSVYAKIQSIVDFVSGMTDDYALNLYRKISGISLPKIV